MSRRLAQISERPNPRMKLPARGGRLKGNGFVNYI